MMGYTHAATGAAGAGALVLLSGAFSAGIFVAAVTAGTIGGVAIDIDTKDHTENPKVTDAGRTRIAALGLTGIAVFLDIILNFANFITRYPIIL